MTASTPICIVHRVFNSFQLSQIISRGDEQGLAMLIILTPEMIWITLGIWDGIRPISLDDGVRQRVEVCYSLLRQTTRYVLRL